MNNLYKWLILAVAAIGLYYYATKNNFNFKSIFGKCGCDHTTGCDVSKAPKVATPPAEPTIPTEPKIDAPTATPKTALPENSTPVASPVEPAKAAAAVK